MARARLHALFQLSYIHERAIQIDSELNGNASLFRLTNYLGPLALDIGHVIHRAANCLTTNFSGVGTITIAANDLKSAHEL